MNDAKSTTKKNRPSAELNLHGLVLASTGLRVALVGYVTCLTI